MKFFKSEILVPTVTEDGANPKKHLNDRDMNVLNNSSAAMFLTGEYRLFMKKLSPEESKKEVENVTPKMGS